MQPFMTSTDNGLDFSPSVEFTYAFTIQANYEPQYCALQWIAYIVVEWLMPIDVVCKWNTG